jgi:Arc/MetJ-type ribon-helix-helix transcriptional regulator
MVGGMATKKYTVTLPEELAEEIRAKVGPGAFSAYVTEAVQRKRENERLGELVEWMEEQHGPVTETELAAAMDERHQFERFFAGRGSMAGDAAEAANVADTADMADMAETDHADTDYPMAS